PPIPLLAQTQLTPEQERRLAEAKKLNDQVVEIYQQGNYSTAEPLYQQALAIRKEILGEKHPDTAQSLN
ncbi:MAG: tetratricopeptide repeat protein, partial [Cyanobacteriota bacterium]